MAKRYREIEYRGGKVLQVITFAYLIYTVSQKTSTLYRPRAQPLGGRGVRTPPRYDIIGRVYRAVKINVSDVHFDIF